MDIFFIVLFSLFYCSQGFQLTVLRSRCRHSTLECLSNVNPEKVMIGSSSSNTYQSLVELESGPNSTATFLIESPAIFSSRRIIVIEEESSSRNQLSKTISFLSRAALIGIFTGLGVVLFKSSIDLTQKALYETLADVLPKPAFYWPLALYPLIGASVVSLLTYVQGLKIRNGIDSIARSIDVATSNITVQNAFDPKVQIVRMAAAVATLGSGCSLGPEGPSVEIGASFSRLVAGGNGVSQREKHHLFLAGTASGVAAGFSAPIAGVFFAIECGNRYLSKNTIKLDEEAPDGPRVDIAAIVLAASLADIVVGVGGLESKEMLTIQGNSFAMVSPLFELPVYVILGMICGLISVVFTKLQEITREMLRSLAPLNRLPPHLQPLLAGGICGVVAVFYPQTLFFGYSTLDQLLAGKFKFELPLLLQLLVSKIVLTSISLSSGLVGGVFAPSAFLGAVTGAAYHDVIENFLAVLDINMHSQGSLMIPSSTVDSTSSLLSSSYAWLMNFILPAGAASLPDAAAYATVGAAATLGSLFRAPLTSSMLMFELTQNHDIVLPVLITTGLGGVFAELISQPRKQW